MPLSNFAGTYETDDYNAALYLIYQLSSPDEQLSAEESKKGALLLREIFQRLETGAKISVEALKSLQQAAENIPEIGPLMFSPGNLTGTVATAAGAVMAAAQTKKVMDLLDLTAAQKAKLNSWADARGTASARSASKTFKGTIRIISKEGKLFFEIPTTAVARHYILMGKVGQSVAHIPLINTNTALSQSARLHADGATGILKRLGGPYVGMAIAVGPQLAIDASNSQSWKELYNKSADNQPTNVISAVAGIGGGSAVGIVTGALSLPAAPLAVVIGVGFIVGLGVQWVIVENGWDKKIGKALQI
ncbi:hypothetical protein A988_18168 [Pseudomonas syringae BRIP39023]|uniref:Uncharacterized protein n=4 Tax=Pseudomonas TaxID=286 RepID=A0A8T8M4M5_PSESX|nr:MULTISPECIES: DUF5118 domain-containing protein [Pseudomonas]KTC10405.1 hypothetical protein AO388_05110 [Pseudomonas sp. ICMP 10191]ALE00617.1 hypothetical protein PSYRMG_15395 [Pseudomonas syringae UMAF0158]ELQ09514.1 hypothetical protein A988_18168 [Pseudomonas syringae BRIP39023]MCK9689861.1 DUF5118 domain-containing protein [Pseudomonas syringae pv. syringae]MCK9734337.1 DUF5118 domain-containing protein [Pseudomonas syringae pv. syringae]